MYFLIQLGEEEFEIKTGDKIAELIFEKIKTLTILKVDDLEGTQRGAQVYGNTCIQSSIAS